MNTSNLLAVGIGGACGTIFRVLIAHILPTSILQLPLKILIINILGCFTLGMLTEFMACYWSPSALIRSFLIPGFLGGFTTFSAFSLEYALLVKRNFFSWAMLYAMLSFCLTIIAFFIGMKIIKICYNYNLP